MRALCLRWLWTAWKHLDGPWIGTNLPCDDNDRELFASTTMVTIGNGRKATFWNCTWLGEQPFRQRFPTLFKHSIRKNRTVAEALREDRWIMDLRHGNTNEIISQFVSLLHCIREANITLTEDTKVEIFWKTAGQYTARAAYDMQFNSQPRGTLQQLV